MIEEIGHADTGLGVRIYEALVTGVHRWRNPSCLSRLVSTNKSAIERLVDQCSKIERVKCRERPLFDGVPATARQLGRRIAVDARHQAAVGLPKRLAILRYWSKGTKPRVATYVDYGVIVVDGTQDVESAKFPLATLRRVYRPDIDVPVNRQCVLVDEFQGSLGMVSFPTGLLRRAEGQSVQQRYGVPILWLREQGTSASHASATAQGVPSRCRCRYPSVKHSQAGLPSPIGRGPVYLDRIEDLDDTGVAQGSKLLQRVSREW